MSKTTKSIIFIIMSALAFACMNLFVRLSGDIPTMQKAFFRNAVALVVSFIALMKNRTTWKVGKKAWGAMIIRSLAGTVGILCSFYAVDNMAIADASMLNKLSPFFVLIFSFFILKEKPSKFDWIAVAIAFGGALFIIRPELNSNIFPAIMGVIGGLGAGLAYTFVRKASLHGASKHLIIFVFACVSCSVSVPYMIFNYTPMSMEQLALLLGAGIFATIGQICITTAYANSAAKDISVFDYSIVIFAAILSIIFLDEAPELLSYVGYVIIIGIAVVKWIVGKRADKAVSENCVKVGEQLSADSMQSQVNEKE